MTATPPPIATLGDDDDGTTRLSPASQSPPKANSRSSSTDGSAMEDQEGGSPYHSARSSPLKVVAKTQADPFPFGMPSFARLDDRDEGDDPTREFSPRLQALLRNTPSAADDDEDEDLPDLQTAFSQLPPSQTVAKSQIKIIPKREADTSPARPMSRPKPNVKPSRVDPGASASTSQPTADASPQRTTLKGSMKPKKRKTAPALDFSDDRDYTQPEGPPASFGPPRRSDRVSAAPDRLVIEGSSQANTGPSSKISRTDASSDVGSARRSRKPSSASTLTQSTKPQSQVEVSIPRFTQGPSSLPPPKVTDDEHRSSTSPTKPASSAKPPSSHQTPSTEPPRPPIGRKHPKYWFLDGSVIIRLGVGSTATLFKLHRSMLVTKSKYFESHLRTNNTPHCPVYDIPAPLGLTVEDFVVLLDAMTDGLTFVSDDLPFSTLASLLRASTKLQCTAIQRWGVSTVQKLWNPSVYFAELGTENEKEHLWAADTIILARSLDADVIGNVLKAAFYELVRQADYGMNFIKEEEEARPKKQSKGKAKEDALIIIDSDDEEPTSPTRYRHLSPADYNRLVRTRTELMDQWARYALRPMSTCTAIIQKPRTFDDPTLAEEPAEGVPAAPTTPATLPPLPCSVNQCIAWTRLVLDSRIYQDYMYDPIAGLEHLYQASQEWGDDIWCGACAETQRHDWRKAKEKIVSKHLGRWLGL